METSAVTSISPVKPLAPYVGGKRSLAKFIIARINEVPHDGYAEPFVGMGGIFFRRDRRPRHEVINDWSGDVAVLFRILQRHYQSFMDELRWKLASRDEFDRLMRMEPESLTDLERAARFLYLQRLAFGGKVVGRDFAMAKERASRFDITRLAPMLADVHERLAGVTIERLPWQDFMARYDRPGMLMVLDPPYLGTEDYYGKGMFARPDFAALAEQLRTMRGRFIMTINDTPETRALFDGFRMKEAALFYRLSGGATEAKELIISN
jgi:DNA adenine methylase